MAFWDFDELRRFVLHCKGKPAIRKLRLMWFDNWRAGEDYEKIYDLVTSLGGIIE